MSVSVGMAKKGLRMRTFPRYLENILQHYRNPLRHVVLHEPFLHPVVSLLPHGDSLPFQPSGVKV
jgi:hypothetical protein